MIEEKKLGIENAKKLVGFAKVMEWVFESFKDGKLTAAELWQGLGKIPLIWDILINGKVILEELRDLDIPEELKVLVDAFAEEFDISDDELESDVEDILDGAEQMAEGGKKVYDAVKRIADRAKN